MHVNNQECLFKKTDTISYGVHVHTIICNSSLSNWKNRKDLENSIQKGCVEFNERQPN